MSELNETKQTAAVVRGVVYAICLIVVWMTVLFFLPWMWDEPFPSLWTSRAGWIVIAGGILSTTILGFSWRFRRIEWAFLPLVIAGAATLVTAITFQVIAGIDKYEYNDLAVGWGIFAFVWVASIIRLNIRSRRDMTRSNMIVWVATMMSIAIVAPHIALRYPNAFADDDAFLQAGATYGDVMSRILPDGSILLADPYLSQLPTVSAADPAALASESGAMAVGARVRDGKVELRVVHEAGNSSGGAATKVTYEFVPACTPGGQRESIDRWSAPLSQSPLTRAASITPDDIATGRYNGAGVAAQFGPSLGSVTCLMVVDSFGASLIKAGAPKFATDCVLPLLKAGYPVRDLRMVAPDSFEDEACANRLTALAQAARTAEGSSPAGVTDPSMPNDPAAVGVPVDPRATAVSPIAPVAPGVSDGSITP